MNDISESFTLVHLMDTVVNLNHAVSIVGKLIADSSCKNVLPLTRESLNITCSYFKEGVIFAMFETVFYSFRYVYNKSKP